MRYWVSCSVTHEVAGSCLTVVSITVLQTPYTSYQHNAVYLFTTSMSRTHLNFVVTYWGIPTEFVCLTTTNSCCVAVLGGFQLTPFGLDPVSQEAHSSCHGVCCVIQILGKYQSEYATDALPLSWATGLLHLSLGSPIFLIPHSL
jgi:hypothetical protein